MILPLEGDKAKGWAPGQPEVFLDGPSLKAGPVFSPDGKWLAYGERVAVAPQLEPTAQNRVVLVFNFFDELSRVAPVAPR